MRVAKILGAGTADYAKIIINLFTEDILIDDIFRAKQLLLISGLHLKVIETICI